MDDLQLFVRNDEELVRLLTTLKEVSNDIGMGPGLHKCKKATSVRGKHRQTASIKLDIIGFQITSVILVLCQTKIVVSIPYRREKSREDWI